MHRYVIIPLANKRHFASFSFSFCKSSWWSVTFGASTIFNYRGKKDIHDILLLKLKKSSCFIRYQVLILFSQNWSIVLAKCKYNNTANRFNLGQKIFFLYLIAVLLMSNSDALLRLNSKSIEQSYFFKCHLPSWKTLHATLHFSLSVRLGETWYFPGFVSSENAFTQACSWWHCSESSPNTN